jgi:hypothetical protein
LLVYFMRGLHSVSSYQPASAEEIGRRAAPFQNNTPETNGIFRIVQQQHRELGVMFSRLETEAEMGWSLALLGTLLFSSLSGVLALCLVLLPRNDRGSERVDPEVIGNK